MQHMKHKTAPADQFLKKSEMLKKTDLAAKFENISCKASADSLKDNLKNICTEAKNYRFVLQELIKLLFAAHSNLKRLCSSIYS